MEKSVLNKNLTDIYITEKFKKDIQKIYGNFTKSDKEYPSMGLTIEGSPIYVACKKLPEDSISRSAYTDKVNADHPSFKSFWSNVLGEFKGKCRKSFVHIHPMNLPRLSRVDVDNFERVRKNPSSPNTFGVDHPLPVILINLKQDRQLEILGFWVYNSKCYKAEIVTIDGDDPIIEKAWQDAEPMPYFSKEANYVNYIDNIVDDEWKVKLGVKNGGKDKALLARKGKYKCIVGFTGSNFLNLSNKFLHKNEKPFVEYIKWQEVFEDIINKKYEKELSDNNSKNDSKSNEIIPEINNINRNSMLKRLTNLENMFRNLQKTNKEYQSPEVNNESLSIKSLLQTNKRKFEK